MDTVKRQQTMDLVKLYSSTLVFLNVHKKRQILDGVGGGVGGGHKCPHAGSTYQSHKDNYQNKKQSKKYYNMAIYSAIIKNIVVI